MRFIRKNQLTELAIVLGAEMEVLLHTASLKQFATEILNSSAEESALINKIRRLDPATLSEISGLDQSDGNKTFHARQIVARLKETRDYGNDPEPDGPNPPSEKNWNWVWWVGGMATIVAFIFLIGWFVLSTKGLPSIPAFPSVPSAITIGASSSEAVAEQKLETLSNCDPEEGWMVDLPNFILNGTCAYQRIPVIETTVEIEVPVVEVEEVVVEIEVPVEKEDAGQVAYDADRIADYPDNFKCSSNEVFGIVDVLMDPGLGFEPTWPAHVVEHRLPSGYIQDGNGNNVPIWLSVYLRPGDLVLVEGTGVCTPGGFFEGPFTSWVKNDTDEQILISYHDGEVVVVTMDEADIYEMASELGKFIISTNGYDQINHLDQIPLYAGQDVDQ